MGRIRIFMLLVVVAACSGDGGASRDQGMDATGDSAMGDTVAPAGDTVMARDTMLLDR